MIRRGSLLSFLHLLQPGCVATHSDFVFSVSLKHDGGYILRKECDFSLLVGKKRLLYSIETAV